MTVTRMVRFPARTHRLFGIAMFALSPVVALAQQRVDIRRVVTSDVSVRVSGAFAAIKVMAWAHDSMAMTGTLPKGARLEGGVGGNNPTPARGAKFWIEPAPTNPGGGTLELRVPAGARVWVKTEHATVVVEGVTGELDLNIVAGSITVRGNPSHANLESMDGTVTIAGSPTWLRVKTADGEVTMRGSSEDMAVTTVSGQVIIGDGSVERARIETVTGGVQFSGTLVRGATLTIDTHSGAIDFASRLKANVSIDARTLTGRIDNGLSTRRPVVGSDGRGEEVKVELGEGTAKAQLRSFKGSMRLTPQS